MMIKPIIVFREHKLKPMPLTIQYCSDLHLEFKDNKAFMKANPLQPAAPVLVLSGDVVPFSMLDRCQDFFSYLADHFETTYWIPGNHEYYHSDAADRSGVLHENIKSNVHLVNNKAFVHDGVKLLMTTLWSKISPAHEWEIERSMNDFHLIKHAGHRFSAWHYNELHSASIAFLQGEIAASGNDKTIVATHHVPTYMHYPPLYKGNILNEAFATELHDMIEPSGIAGWIYGHHHSNIPAYKIGQTHMLTNQLGYVHCGEGAGYENPAVFTVGG
jgi:predicted phosphohydrolase